MTVYQPPARICFPFTGDVVGGSHFSVLGLLENLDPAQFTPVIVPQFPDGQVGRFFTDRGFPVERGLEWTELPYATPVGVRQVASALSDVPRQIRFLKSRNVDIVHTNDGRTNATWALAARLSGAKLLWHQRGDPTAAGLRLGAPLLANRVACVSRFALPQAGLYSAANKAEVVHSPFDTSLQEDRAAARSEILRETGASSTSHLIGYLGAYVARKRPFLFIDAIAAIARARPDIDVTGLMFGEDYDGSTEAALVRHAEASGIAQRIKFMGFRPRGSYWLAGCDVLMIPAIGEPFGRTLIEAMLVGTPVVATASGGNVEALRDGAIGLLVPPEDACALARGCLRLFDDPALARGLASRAEADARRRFGVHVHADRIMAIYREMLAPRQIAIHALSNTECST